MEKLLMQQCRYHEMRERLMDTMVQERLHEKITQMETINSEHRQCYAGQIYRVHQHSRGDLQRQRQTQQICRVLLEDEAWRSVCVHVGGV